VYRVWTCVVCATNVNTLVFVPLYTVLYVPFYTFLYMCVSRVNVCRVRNKCEHICLCSALHSPICVYRVWMGVRRTVTVNTAAFVPLFIFIDTCMYIYVYIYIHTSINIHIIIYVYIYIHIYAYIHIHIYIYVCIYVWICKYMYMYT